MTSLTVNFTDLSTGSISTWAWTFGDGGSSSAQSPSYQHNSAGTYNVSLTVTGPGGSDVETKNGYITVNPCVAPTAGFVGSPTSGDYPLNVSFTDQSSGASSWSWNFGDGGNSTAQNPSHSYTAAGTYTVTQTVTNACGNDQLVRTNYITVTTPTGPTETHVSAISVTKENLGQGFKRGVASVTILDNNNNPVSGATVTGDFSGKTSDPGLSAVSNGSGVATLFSSSAKGGGEWCFEVTNVTHGTLSYNSSQNNVTMACESGPVFNNGGPSDILTELPSEFVTLQNYPNPFNPSTEISYTLPEAAHIKLDVFNILGQKMNTLVDASVGAGTHTVTWNSTDESGHPVSSGIYFYRVLVNGRNPVTKKMMLLR